MGKIAKTLERMRGAGVYFDTNPIVYFLNQTPRFFDICLPIFQALEAGDFKALSGEICLTELLVKPLKENDALQVRMIKEIFDGGFIQLLPHNREVFELTAQIRASKNLKTIDALHAATAIQNGCQFIVTGDNSIAKRVAGLEVVNLNDLLKVK